MVREGRRTESLGCWLCGKVIEEHWSGGIPGLGRKGLRSLAVVCKGFLQFDGRSCEVRLMIGSPGNSGIDRVQVDQPVRRQKALMERIVEMVACLSVWIVSTSTYERRECDVSFLRLMMLCWQSQR